MNKLNLEVLKKEELGRTKFDNFCEGQEWCRVKKYSKPENNDVWDVAAFSAGTAMICEIKNRSNYFNQYDSTIMEVNKLNNLKQIKSKCELNDIKLVFINFYGDGGVRMWDVTDIQPQVETKLLPKNNTYGDMHNRNIFHLNNADAFFSLPPNLT